MVWDPKVAKLAELAAAWPEPNADGSTTLPPTQTAQVLLFFGYVRGYVSSNERCKSP